MRFESVLMVARFCCIYWNSMLVHLDKRLGSYIDAAVGIVCKWIPQGRGTASFVGRVHTIVYIHGVRVYSEDLHRVLHGPYT